MRRLVRSLLLVLFLLAPAAGFGVAPLEEDIRVAVSKDGGVVRVDVELDVDATQEEVWNVLTDYPGMPRFLPMLESSVVLNRDGNRLEVAQHGRASHGPVSFAFDNVRRIVLTPQREISARIVSGDLAPGEVTTKLSSDGATTLVRVHGEYRPDIWIPPVVGPALIAEETREQWKLLRKEIVARRARHG